MNLCTPAPLHFCTLHLCSAPAPLQCRVCTCTSPGLETIYPFPRTVKVEAAASVAVWSSGEAEHRPKEGQYVMKEGAWRMADATATVLYDKEEQVIATRDTRREQETSGSSR